MEPYLAIIKDSFREAMASRILWVLLIVITIILILAMPLGFREITTTRLVDRDFIELRELVDRIRTEGAREFPSPSKRIWQSFDEEFQQRLIAFGPPKDGDFAGAMKLQRTADAFVDEMNELIKAPDFYDSESWKRVRMPTQEAQALLKQVEDGEELSDEQASRLNRLAIEWAFPDLIRISLPTSLQLRYFTFDTLPAFPISKNQLDDQITVWAAFLMKWFVGVVGVVIAILVTASIVPQTFDPGSLNLLLSKPISRWLMFLSKYIGGCAFTFVNATYLIGGLWLVLGIRFGIWDYQLLLSIPIYIFMFAIYYSVSAISGVIWRNPVISIVMSILFWLICLLVGFFKTTYETYALEKRQFVRLIQVDDSLMAVNQMALVNRWDPEKERWREVFESDDQKMMRVAAAITDLPPQLRPVGAVYDSKNKRLLNVQRSMRSGSLNTSVGVEEENWESRNGASAPSGTFQLLSEPSGGVLAVSSLGIYRLTGDPLASSKPVKMFGITIPVPRGGPFRSVGPEEAVILTPPAAASVHPDSGDLALFSRGKLTLLSKTEKRFERRDEREYEELEGEVVLLAYAGSTILLARGNGELWLVADDDLSSREVVKAPTGRSPWLVSASPDGKRFALTMKGGELWLLDADAKGLTKPRIKGQGEISATWFESPERLYVTYQSTRVLPYQVPEFNPLEPRYTPPMKVVERGYRYFLKPLYTIFPKPGELDNTIDYLLASKDDKRDFEDPWAPVWSSLGFLVVVLFLACIYIERQEF